ncbi:RNA polymerase sigma factor [Kitasatospora aureofaciens]|uniref:RNA polymerase sigma factor n=1 Tax=Kitasatospora aureofaciens TaxID=1894 RepID=UPI000525065A|nr:sigma-70 family RNA polymerase sigma factor [Kitasatospora aureofaciens]
MEDATPSPTSVGFAEPDGAAFSRFVETATTPLYAYAVKLTGSRYLADDILQEALEECLKRWSTLRMERPDGNGLIQRPYVFEIIRHKYVDYLRSVRRRETRNEKWVSQTLPLIVQVLPDSECIFDQTARELWAAVGELDPTQQILIQLVYVEEKSITQSAKEIGIPPTTARRRHKAALEQLRLLIGGGE